MSVRLTAMLVVGVLGLAAASAATGATAPPQPIVTVVEHGGLCLDRMECRSLFRITDRTISGTGYVPRRLAPSERAALLRAIRALDPAYLRAHPFEGICPTAYDGSESIYRFRGFARSLASCTYDLRRVQAVRLTQRLLATLKLR